MPRTARQRGNKEDSALSGSEHPPGKKAAAAELARWARRQGGAGRDWAGLGGTLGGLGIAAPDAFGVCDSRGE